VHAVVEPHDFDAPPSVEDLRSHCRDRLAAYKVPKTFEFVERMPRSAAGKLRRSTLGDASSEAGTETDA
jgi:acyl-CoA synthetase (AMP-forming)/AMP-acid ligase II